MNNSTIHRRFKGLALLAGLLFICRFSTPLLSYAQDGKSRKKIEIDTAGVLYFNNEVRRLIGSVQLSHENIIIFCDSAWSYTISNEVDAFGHVHVISNDTLNLYSDFMHYTGKNSFAKAYGHVMLKDPRMTLTTDTLDYDMKQDIGYYECWGTVVDSSNTLTSRVGQYFSNENLLYFKDSVVLINEKYTLWSDTLKYNTQTEVAHIVGPTRIESDTTSIYSENGWFDTRNQTSELLKNSTIRRGNSQLQADTIYYNDSNGAGYARSRVIINDFTNEIIVAGHYGKYNDFDQFALVTDSALFIQYHDGDSLYLHADSIAIAPDTIAEGQKRIHNYYNVRFFRSDMQGRCDSLVYITNDSTIQLYSDPVLWLDKNQLTARYIEAVNHANPPNLVYLKEDAFIIQQVDSMKFNQIKGKNMIGYINGKDLYLIDVSGNGQSIFYPEDDKGVLGANKAESSNIMIHLIENRIKRISYINTPAGKMKPLSQLEDGDKELEGFIWRESERPVDRFDIFRKKGEAPSNHNLPDTNIHIGLDDPQKRPEPGKLKKAGFLNETDRPVSPIQEERIETDSTLQTPVEPQNQEKER